MKHPLFVAISTGLLWLLVAGVAHDARAAEAPLVVRVTSEPPTAAYARPHASCACAGMR
jgi:hypothetical protein